VLVLVLQVTRRQGGVYVLPPTLGGWNFVYHVSDLMHATRYRDGIADLRLLGSK
jgi:hypothetical protein